MNLFYMFVLQAALTDLMNIVRLIGRQEVAACIETDVGSWV